MASILQKDLTENFILYLVFVLSQSNLTKELKRLQKIKCHIHVKSSELTRLFCIILYTIKKFLTKSLYTYK